jgi:hypothetical protein
MKGRAIPLSRARRLVVEHCRLAQDVPKGVLRGEIDLAPLLPARAAAGPERPPWTAIFAKAQALTAAEMPALRRIYVKLPWPLLYEVPRSVAAVVVERPLDGEPAVFYARIGAPELLPLSAIAARIREVKDAPLDSVKDHRTALLLARLPLPLRRAAFWIGRNLGRQVPNHFGTFAVSVVGGQGIDIVLGVSHWTSFLSYGPIRADGRVEVFVTFDHRVMDGGTAAQAIRRLEATLHGTLLAELRAMAQAPPFPAVAA